MDMLATLRRSGGIDALARQLGLPPARAAMGVEALLPGALRRLVERGGTRVGDGGALGPGIGALIARLDAVDPRGSDRAG